VPVIGSPALTITPDTCKPTPKTVTWEIPDGLAINGITGTGKSVDVNATILFAPVGGTQRPRSWILPITVLDGFSYSGPATITLRQARECAAPTPEPTPTPTPTPPADPTPDPTDAAATPPQDSGQVPPAEAVAQPPHPASGQIEQAATSPVALAASSAGELAYTGADPATTVGGSVAAACMIGLGSVILAKRRRPRARHAR
jgi:hypothetical protein